MKGALAMKIKFDDAAIAKIQPMLGDDKKLLLTFEDGVGQYSQHAMIHMQVQFSINIVAKDAPTDEYDETIPSNLGDMLIKGYSKEDLDNNMVISFKKNMNTLQLHGDGGPIDDNMGLIDFTDPDGIRKNPAR